jgi:hypothetical protein
MYNFRSFLTKIELTTMKGVGNKKNIKDVINEIYTK